LVEVMAMNYFKYITNNGDIYELSQPEWLWLIPFFIVIIVITRMIKSKHISKSAQASLSDVSSKQILLHPLLSVIQLNESTVKTNPSSRKLYFFIFLILVLSLTQPIRIGEKLPDPPQERDITFIVDTSVSMILRDYILNGERIDRMNLLKGVLDDFIQRLKGERMSIIVFGDQAYTLVPLTTDQFLLRRMLSRVQATMAGRFNAIGDAIALAVKEAQHTYNNKDEAIKRKRILVLLTDADQPTGAIDPVIAAQLAKNANLPLYTIAIGATSLAAEESRLGGLLYSPVDLNYIQKLSSITHAKSYQAGNPKALEKAIQAISTHETNKREVKIKYYHEPLYYWLLITAFILFTLNQIVTIIKPTLVSYLNTKNTG